jgi:hypothetical protein
MTDGMTYPFKLISNQTITLLFEHYDSIAPILNLRSGSGTPLEKLNFQCIYYQSESKQITTAPSQSLELKLIHQSEDSLSYQIPERKGAYEFIISSPKE